MISTKMGEKTNQWQFGLSDPESLEFFYWRSWPKSKYQPRLSSETFTKTVLGTLRALLNLHQQPL